MEANETSEEERLVSYSRLDDGLSRPTLTELLQDHWRSSVKKLRAGSNANILTQRASGCSAPVHHKDVLHIY